MAKDDWRIHVELPEDSEGTLGRLGLNLGSRAHELARELEGRRLAVSQDGSDLFVYAGTRREAERAREVVEAELADEGLQAQTSRVQHWLHEQGHWSDELPEPSVDDELLAEGFAPWEVRVECESRDAARALAEQLESEGYGVVRQFRYVIAGTSTREEAKTLAERVHGEVEAGGELVWEAFPGNPFAIFGGMGGTGTPI
ncbi:MAG: hypothetical protein QOH02_526 [Gaiellaceae bacterium]|nr:hypothetical protein [Gaiellaceae bacterium]